MTETDEIVRLRVHISEEIAQGLDALRGREKGIPSRSEFARRIVQDYIASRQERPTRASSS